LQEKKKSSPPICFQALLGEKLGEFVLPTRIDANIYDEILTSLTGNDNELLSKWYKQRDNGDGYTLSTDYR
jgi:hypothetical protein